MYSVKSLVLFTSLAGKKPRVYYLYYTLLYFTCYDVIMCSAPSVPPTNIRGLAIDHSSIILEWDAPPNLLTNGIITTYIINVTERETGYTFERNTSSTSIVLGSVHPDYVYECRVAAFTIAAGPFSTIFAIQVLMAGKGDPSLFLTVTHSLVSIAPSWHVHTCIIPTHVMYHTTTFIGCSYTPLETLTPGPSGFYRL